MELTAEVWLVCQSTSHQGLVLLPWYMVNEVTVRDILRDIGASSPVLLRDGQNCRQAISNKR